MFNYYFPFEKIKKDSRIIIYATGNVGSQFLQKIRETDYCTVVCALDKKYEDKSDYPVPVFHPEKLKEFGQDSYDSVLIAVSEYNLSCVIEKYLIELGVPKEKIVKNSGGTIVKFDGFDEARIIDYDDGSNVLKLAVVCYGGVGDFLLTSQMLRAFKRVMPDNLMVDFWISSTALFKTMPFIDNIYDSANFSQINDYDVVLIGGNFFEIAKINLNKIKRFSKVLYDYFQNNIWHYNNVFPISESSVSNRLLQYCRLLGKNRVEQQNISGILPLDRNTPAFLDVLPESLEKIEKLNLYKRKYITICTIVNADYTKSPKLYPLSYFNDVVLMIKNSFPDIYIVRVGESDGDGELHSIDLNICGKTSLQELCAVMKCSALHIGCEGGLIHLNHFLGGTSCSIFGGTVPEVYGYDENINLRSDFPANCSFGCEHINYMWTNNGCLLDREAEYPLCTKALKPAEIFKPIYDFLSNLPVYKYTAFGIDTMEDITSKNSSIAIVGRADEKLLMTLYKKSDKITVFDRDLSEESSSGVINELYAKRLEEIGINAEYASVYNIPSSGNSFDLTICFSEISDETGYYALIELIRITKTGGMVILKMSDSIETACSELNIGETHNNHKFIAIRKDAVV
jgi:ADP-heptose:LPS heptosyltransferase